MELGLQALLFFAGTGGAGAVPMTGAADAFAGTAGPVPIAGADATAGPPGAAFVAVTAGAAGFVAAFPVPFPAFDLFQERSAHLSIVSKQPVEGCCWDLDFSADLEGLQFLR